MEVRVLKLMNGEEIIAEVAEKIDEDGERQWVLNNPRLVIATQEGLALVPFPPYVESDVIKVRTDHTSYVLVPHEKMLNHYKELVGAIVVPSQKIIV